MTTALIRRYAEDAKMYRRIEVVPNKRFNGYPYPGEGYVAGDFMVHLRRLNAADREAAMKNHAAMAG